MAGRHQPLAWQAGRGPSRWFDPGGWALVAVVLCLAGWPIPSRAGESPGPAPGVVEADTVSGGPAYSFRVGTLEVTNAQFVTFLNDALAHPDDERGAYLYHATDTGSVYVHTAQTGAQGPDEGGTPVFDASVNGHILFTGEAYELDDPSWANHPVNGASWFGAVKYCNWLTIDRGLGAARRCYHEGPSGDLAAWRPKTISKSDWQVRDLEATERQALVEEYAGYRLPMDQGQSGAGAYNEWYKAAAWDPAGGVHRTYGFGRDSIDPGGADANHYNSGDPYDNGSTPVAFYGVDGDRFWDEAGFGWGFSPPESFVVADTDNAYGLHDASGNVWEWVQDQATDPARRGIRGGSWQSSSYSLRCTTRSDRDAAAASATTGLRVVQSLWQSLLVVPETGLVAGGPFGGPYDVPQADYTLINLSNQPIDYRVEPDTDWVTIDGSASPLEGTLQPEEQVVVTVGFDVACESGVGLGVNAATVSFTNQTEQVTEQRDVELTLSEPLIVSPDGDLEASGPIGGPFAPDEAVYTISSVSDAAITWEVEADQTWVTVDGVPGGGTPVGGTLEPPDTAVEVAVGFHDSAQTLEAGTYTAVVTFRDACTGQTFTRGVTLQIGPTLSVSPAGEALFGGVIDGPCRPDSVDYTLTNLSDLALLWEITADDSPAWLLIDGAAEASGELDPLGSAVVTVEPAPDAWTIDPGTYTTTLRFRDITDPEHIQEITREATLLVPEFAVSPLEDFASAGAAGGPFNPAEQTYTVSYQGDLELPWLATYTTSPEGGAWLSLNDGPSAEGIIVEAGGSADVVVALNAQADGLEPGTYSAQIEFEDLLTGVRLCRTVELVITAFSFNLPMAIVAGDDAQPGGPTYTYRIGTREVTNTEYAAFLNDALVHLSDARGAYLYHDTDSGDVYLTGSTVAEGQVGTAGSGTLVFDASDGGGITYDAGQGRYVVASGRGALPAVGVSWYGAAKFCNWMTLIQELAPEQQAYTEGGQPEDWSPATIAAPEDWLVRDLTADERAALTALAGFRLPMDDSAAEAAPYSEWYKASAWDPLEETHSAYGFGRDALTDADANYLNSGDPYEGDSPPLAPAGFYDGVGLLADGETVTSDTENGYALYDLCGNAAEWMQDHGAGPGERATRGGSALDPSGSADLRNDGRGSDLPAATRSFTGFRVVQSLAPAVEVQVMPEEGWSVDGVIGGPFSSSAITYTVSNNSPVSREWSAGVDADWLEVNGASSASGLLPPLGELELKLELTDTAFTLFDETDPLERAATLTITDATTDHAITRPVTLTLGQPIAVVPEAGLISSGPFRGFQPPADPFEPPAATYTMTSVSGSTMAYEVTADADWADVDVDTGSTTPGQLELDEQVEVQVALGATAADLLPGRHAATVSFRNVTTGAVLAREVELTVTDAVDVAAAGDDAYSVADLIAPAGLYACLTGPGSAGPAMECAPFDFDADDDVDLADFQAFTLAAGDADFRPVGVWGGPFDALGLEHEYTLASLLEIPLDYTVTTDVSWLTLDGDQLSGTLPAQPAQLTFTATVNEQADDLEVGLHAGTITFTYEDGGVAGEVTRTVRLTVLDPLEVTPWEDVQAFYNPPEAPTLDAGAFTLHNNGDDLVGWQMDSDQPWLTLDGVATATGTLLPDAGTDVALDVDAGEAAKLSEGTYQATVTVADLLTGHVQQRRVILTVDESLAVAPLSGLSAYGIVGEEVSPGLQVYTLTNRTDAPLAWRVSRAEPADSWVLIETGDAAEDSLAPGEQTEVTISLDQGQVTGFASGSYEAEVLFENLTAEVTVTTRQVTVVLSDPAPPVDTTSVSADDAQPGGPGYAFEIASCEVTNADFAAFLNDAFHNPDNERGYYLYHDTDSGDVFVHTAQTGAQGTDGSDTLSVRMFSASANAGRISFSGGSEPYTVTAGFERHPVVGVSWYGALKYCNWLTLTQGIGVAARCYQEGPADDLDAWRPVTITQADWQARDLDDAERQALVEGYAGYRLPMDDGSSNPDPWEDAADAYNEWYKAAAWDQDAGVNRVYGFGRDTVSGADANYWNSGDPFEGDASEPRTAPVGFYGIDGDRVWDDPDFGWGFQPPDSFTVADTDNHYGLHDMSGNAAEWVQDRYSGKNTRALRSGSWANFSAQGVWIRTFDRSFASPSLTWGEIGFRVVRVAD